MPRKSYFINRTFNTLVALMIIGLLTAALMPSNTIADNGPNPPIPHDTIDTTGGEQAPLSDPLDNANELGDDLDLLTQLLIYFS